MRSRRPTQATTTSTSDLAPDHDSRATSLKSLGQRSVTVRERSFTNHLLPRTRDTRLSSPSSRNTTTGIYDCRSNGCCQT